MIQLEVTSPSTRKPSSSMGLLSVGASVPIGQRGLVHVWGQNDVAISRKLGIHWIVKDPDEWIVENYEDWEFGDTGPGDDHEFIGGRFDLDKEGTYTIAVNLLMNRDSPVVVDSYEGDLCTTTTEVPPEFDLIQHTIYPYAYIYDGDVEETIATFKTDPFTPAAWMGEQFASKLEEEVRARGGRPIEVKVYVDKTPLLWTDFRIDIISTPIGGVAEATSGIAVGIALWLSIILVCLAIIAVIVIATLAIKTIVGLFNTYPGLHEVKPGWGKETLMLTIHDSEEYWERPLTPAATLEGMSEQELRDYLDQVAEEEVKPGLPSWLPWAIVGGVVVIGGGAAIALTAGRK